ARCKDGTEFPCDISLHPLPTQHGLQVMVNIVDITERKRIEAEKRKQESHRRLRFMIENLPAGAVYVAGANITVNRTTEPIPGHHRDERRAFEACLPNPFGTDQNEWKAAYSPDRERWFSEPRVWEIGRHDGQRRTLEFAAFRDEQHEVWLIRDITDRRLAQ